MTTLITAAKETICLRDHATIKLCAVIVVPTINGVDLRPSNIQCNKIGNPGASSQQQHNNLNGAWYFFYHFSGHESS